MAERKHDDAHRPMSGRGQRGNRLGRPINLGGATLVAHRICAGCEKFDYECACGAAGNERAAFEASIVRTHPRTTLTRWNSNTVGSAAPGDYLDPFVQAKWEGWRERASSGNTPDQQEQKR